jgi:CRISPR-associated protein, Csy3 family
MAKTKKSDGISFETGMLAYARSLQISEGVFFGLRGETAIPVLVLEKGVRGQTSNDLKPNKEKDAANSNIQTVEFAALPQGCDSVRLDFSVRILPMTRKPYACDNTDVGETYIEFVKEYARVGGFHTLAELYVWNIANARFAWRNRFQTDKSMVKVTFSTETIVFDPAKLSLEQVADREQLSNALVEGDKGAIDRFIAGVARGLSEMPFAFEVSWQADMKPGQEIFPSQEYIREEVGKTKSDLSRVYAKLPTFFSGEGANQASMHSQKIGAALRHIDVWHGDDTYGAIPVNPYGGVQETSAVLRKPRTNSFFDIRKNAEDILASLRIAQSTSDVPGHIHFMMANLVRGGVFGSSKSSEAA